MGKLKEQSVFGESPDWKGKAPNPPMHCKMTLSSINCSCHTHTVERAGCSFKGGWAGRGCCCWQLVATKANLISFAPTNQPSPASAHAPCTMSPLFGSFWFIIVHQSDALVKQLRPAGDVIVQFTLRFLIQVCAERAGAGGSTRVRCPAESLGTCSPPMTSTSVCGEPSLPLNSIVASSMDIIGSPVTNRSLLIDIQSLGSSDST